MNDRPGNPIPEGPRWLSPEKVLVAGMVVAAVLVFWFGRNLTFSEDELSIISRIGVLNWNELIEPYLGHLMTVPLSAYWVALKVFGPDQYAVFQALTLLSIYALAWVMFLWARERVPPWIALAPSLLLLVFPQDVLHYLLGNGFVIVLALALGLGALYAFEKDERRWDVAAFGLIVLGLMTYTVAAAFAVGLVVAAAVRGEWWRSWVGGLPVLIYGVWRLTVAASTEELAGTQPDWGNLLLLPAWTFQALGGTLAALLGGGFDFLVLPPGSGTGAPDFVAPALASLLVVAIGAAVARGRAERSLVVVAVVTLALFSSQALVWGTFESRPGPGAERYLYPSALVVLMLILEASRRVAWDRRKVTVVVAVTAIALVGAAGSLANRDRNELATKVSRAEVLAITLLDSTGDPIPLNNQPRRATQPEFDPVPSSRFGYLGFTESELVEQEDFLRRYVDRFLAESLRLRLRTVEPDREPWACRPAAAAPVTALDRVPLPRKGAILFARAPVQPQLGRYGDKAVVRIGTIDSGAPRILRLKRDDGKMPWFISAGPGAGGSLSDLIICRHRKAGKGSPAATNG